MPASPFRKRSKRGIIRGFSTRSRRRLLQRIAQINRNDRRVARPLFVTLTYPAAFPTMRASKRDLDVFGKRIRRKYPQASYFWRLEPQRRGAPHYHLIVFGVDFIPKTWLSRAWFEVVGTKDPVHLKAGTQVKRIRSWRGVWSYASKYLAKVEGEVVNEETGEVLGDEWGRHWGIVGAENLPIEIQEIFLMEDDWYKVRRLLVRYLHSKRRRIRLYHRYRGIFAFFAISPEDVDRLIRS